MTTLLDLDTFPSDVDLDVCCVTGARLAETAAAYRWHGRTLDAAATDAALSVHRHAAHPVPYRLTPAAALALPPVRLTRRGRLLRALAVALPAAVLLAVVNAHLPSETDARHLPNDGRPAVPSLCMDRPTDGTDLPGVAYLDPAAPACHPADTAPADTAPEEDEPGWDCATMGNRICGPAVTGTAVTVTDADADAAQAAR